MADTDTLTRINADYDRRGFAPIDFALSPAEEDAIHAYLRGREREGHPGNIHGNDGQLRAVHGYDEGFAPSLIARLSETAKSLIGCRSVYVLQLRANIKHPSRDGGGSWRAHRDFDYWHRIDGMRLPRVAILHILVNEHNQTNGPLVLCDGSHRHEIEPSATGDSGWKASFQEDLKYTIDADVVRAWPEKTVLTGPPGTVVAMHPLTWHHSGPNRSQATRTLLSIVFNDHTNQPVTPAGTERRPGFIIERP